MNNQCARPSGIHSFTNGICGRCGATVIGTGAKVRATHDNVTVTGVVLATALAGFDGQQFRRLYVQDAGDRGGWYWAADVTRV